MLYFVFQVLIHCDVLGLPALLATNTREWHWKTWSHSKKADLECRPARSDQGIIFCSC